MMKSKIAFIEGEVKKDLETRYPKWTIKGISEISEAIPTRHRHCEAQDEL